MLSVVCVFFFKQKTAYEMRISDWSSDVCSSDLFETGCPAIQQMYVYGNSARSFLLAVIVPDKKVVETRLGANPDESELRALIREEMRATAAQDGLRAVEVPRSEERRVGNEGVSTCRFRWWTEPKKKIENKA